MLQWVAADLRTGQILADLPGVTANDALRRSISGYDTATVTVNLAGAGVDWERATLPGASVLACYDDADNTPQQLGPIRWAGFVNQRPRSVSLSQMGLSLATIEAYFDRRYIGDVTWAGALHRDDVIAAMFQYWVIEGSEPGLQLYMSYTPGGGPTLGDTRIWQNTDNATVLTRLTQVLGLYGGEFTCEWKWSPDNTAIYPVAYFGDRVGAAAPAGLGPAVTFESPGSITDATLTEDFTSQAGATKIVAYSSGDGNVTPYAAPVYSGDTVRPTFEYRYSPSPSEPDTTVLGTYAKQSLPVLANGAQALTLQLSADPAVSRTRRVGVDWRLGDDVGVVIAPCDAFPHGYSRVGRVIAYEVTDTTVTPTFADPAVYTVPS